MAEEKKKCSKCGAPLEGFLFKTVGKLFGIKESEKKPGICNKCEEEKKPEEPKEKETEEQEEESEAEAEAEAEAEKEEEKEHKEEKSAQQMLNEEE